ncbi:MAG: hypothetical protein ACE5PV_19735 [Candidatus Poribacteria bacterium]
MSLKPLMFMHPPYDFLEDERTIDFLLEGGVRDIMLGYWTIIDESKEGSSYSYPTIIAEHFGHKTVTGIPVTPCRATHALYEGIGVEPPDLPKEAEKKAESFRRSIQRAHEKGINVYTFGTSDGKPRWTVQPTHSLSAQYTGARLQDYYKNFPMIAGCVLDGPGYGYEIQPGFRGGGQAFAPLCTCEECRSKAESMGLDIDWMNAKKEELQSLLHGLQKEQVTLFLQSQQGMFDVVDLLLSEPIYFDILKFKTHLIDDFIQIIYKKVKEADENLQFGICPRLPCFSTMQGCNFRRLSSITDLINSKHYLWMGGIDGFKGTIHRYAQTLMKWNPSLDEKLVMELIEKLFGFSMPPDYPLSDYEKPAPREFFFGVVYSESKKMLQRIGSKEKISPFIGLEHGGVWLNAQELRYLLEAIEEAGLTRFTYYVFNTITPEIWDVITDFTP